MKECLPVAASLRCAALIAAFDGRELRTDAQVYLGAVAAASRRCLRQRLS